jgi:uncharacterized protein with HEPN domain
MSLPPRDAAVLFDLLKYAQRILDDARIVEDDRFADNDLLDATLYRLTIIGEAVRKVSEDTKRRYNHIPWPLINGLRNVIVHEYHKVKLDKIVLIVRDDLPSLVAGVRAIFQEHGLTQPEHSP